MKKFFINKNGGYIALMTTIIISMVLLVMVSQEAFSGWHARFNILGTESKEQATALADGCIQETLTGIIMGLPYGSGVTTTTPLGTCHVSPIDTTTHGMVIINTQTSVNGSYANVGMSINTNNIHLDPIPSAPASGTLIIQTLVNNGGGTNKTPADFTIHVSGVSPSKSSFAGSATGVIVHVNPGAYSVSEDSISGFVTLPTTDCAGTINGGDIKSCTFSNNPVTTTITLIDNVVNKYKGTNQPSDFQMYVDGTLVTLGQPFPVSVGPHTVSAIVPKEYLASPWGYQCDIDGKINMNLGDNKTCIIEFDDIPPPNPSCADTVMMLDRTGSMNSTELGYEKTAANTLVTLYGLVAPPLPLPKIAVGSFGGLTSATVNSSLVPNGSPAGVYGILTTLYTDITNSINQMMASTSCTTSRSGTDTCTDLGSAIITGSNELSSSRHTSTNEKVLILISDGAPSLPTGNNVSANTPLLSPSANTADTSTSWINPLNAYSGTDSGADATAVIGSGSVKHRFSGFDFSTLPSDSIVNGIEADLDAWTTSSASSGSTTPAPSGSGNLSTWSVTGTSSKTTAVTDGSNGTYVNQGIDAQTFVVANSNIPVGAIVDSVTLYVSAEETGGNATIQLMEESGTGLGQQVLDSPHNLTSTWATYSYAFPKTPTGASWTRTEVNAWTTKFGVFKSSGGGTAQVSRIYTTVSYH